MSFCSDYSVSLLCSANYHAALKVALEIFKSDPNAKEWIPDAYQKAVFPERYSGLNNKFAYWVLIEKKTGKIIGVTGLYTRNKDKTFCYWLGWFGVIESHRGKGLGKFLFNWTIEELQRRKKNVLRILTSDLKYAQSAVELYRKNHCFEIKREKEFLKNRNISYNSIVMEKKL